MRNLEQIRAQNALKAARDQTFKGANDGEVVKKIPAMIRESGLLGAMAFAKENAGKTNHADVFCAIAAHLKTIGKLPGSKTDLEGFLADLCAADAVALRAVTAEAMAYLNYLRRFADKKKAQTL